MTALQSILDTYRTTSKTEREKGTYLEELIRTYLRHEPSYADLYHEVWLYADWANAQGLDARDTGIDLVAQTHGTDEFHAVQCKCYAAGHRVQKADIDSFFTASGQQPFTHRVIVTTTNDWTDNAEKALHGQQPPVTKIDLHDLENSQIDWAKYKPSETPALKPKFDPRPHQQTAITKTLLGLKNADRGKLIMACGTGKTFTSLKIAEALAGRDGRVLLQNRHTRKGGCRTASQEVDSKERGDRRDPGSRHQGDQDARKQSDPVAGQKRAKEPCAPCPHRSEEQRSSQIGTGEAFLSSFPQIAK